MLAYFTASVVGKKYHIDKYRKIIEILESRNIEVIAEHILDTSETQIHMETKEERLKFHRELEKWIGACDFMVTEATFPSISVGYEIALALSHNKPVLCLYCEGDAPSLLAQHENDKLICEKYTLNTLETIITDFLLYVHGGSDTRFTFFLTSRLASYLDKVAKTEKKPKSVYLRDLIEADMKRNKS